MLKNIYEMLKKGGVFRIVVPSLESRIEKYLENKDANKFMESLDCVSKSENTNIINKVRFLFGGSRHRWMYDEKSLYEELKIAGFENIRNCFYGDSRLEIFSEVEEEERFYSNEKTIKEIAFHCVK